MNHCRFDPTLEFARRGVVVRADKGAGKYSGWRRVYTSLQLLHAVIDMLADDPFDMVQVAYDPEQVAAPVRLDHQYSPPCSRGMREMVREIRGLVDYYTFQKGDDDES